MSAFDWPGLMEIGISRLRLKPEEFWRLTPAELRLMVGPVGPKPMGRERLSDLMAAFPDMTKEPDDG
ncbi:MAG: rcc01693 family protein [Pseudomonadota bacterium]